MYRWRRRHREPVELVSFLTFTCSSFLPFTSRASSLCFDTARAYSCPKHRDVRLVVVRLVVDSLTDGGARCVRARRPCVWPLGRAFCWLSCPRAPVRWLRTSLLAASLFIIRWESIDSWVEKGVCACTLCSTMCTPSVDRRALLGLSRAEI